MPQLICIREVKRNEEDFTATVQFGVQGEPYEITVSDPFSNEQEERLEWYFEKWLDFPFTDKVLAREAAASIRVYGESLFEQVFGSNRAVGIEYDRLRQEDFQLEIIGSPEFHALHWEALHDPLQARPLSVDKPVVRKNSKPVTYRAEVKSAPRLRVLLVTARPAGRQDVSYRTISRPLVEALETGRIAAQIDMVRPGTFEALVNHLEDVRDEHGDGYYHIIHLDMHGALLTHGQYVKMAEEHQPASYTFRDGYAQTAIEEYQGLKAFLFFDTAGKKADTGGTPVSADDLAHLLNMRQIPIVILNACQSGKQVGYTETSLGSRLLESGSQLVVAMGYSVTVSAAGKLMTILYRQLLDGRDPAVAIRRARLELYNDKRRRAAFGQKIKLEDWMLPVIYQNRVPGFDRNTFQGQVAVTATAYAPPRTTYRFVGRDIDILEIERRLLRRTNLLLVRGMGGAGKTTLLHHLGWWWQKTRFVNQVFYFGYDLKAYHLPEIVDSIGRQLGLNLSGIAANDRAAVLQALKSTRHLLVLDNLESITGEPLSVQNTLPPEARAELRTFLQELTGARSLVLLGSRSGEKWLRDPLRDADTYDLHGLDYEAQTALAEAILQTAEAPHYPDQDEHQADFQRLLKLLGGYPLAMEVVLTGLAHATPAEIIERLRAADVNLDNQKERATKTESILKCIDYSHSNLSAEAQSLLLCLAPFTGVINLNGLDQYTALLKAQAPLAHLPYDRWQAVLKEALNWGLLQPHERYGESGYLSLQPIFPYFLKTRLNDESLSALKQAVETAFCEHCNGMGGALAEAIRSKEPQERQTGLALTEVEYENLLTSLKISLSAGTDFYNSFDALEEFADKRNDTANRLLICRLVASHQANYTPLQMQGTIGTDFFSANDRLAGTYLQIKDYASAQKYYEHGLVLARLSKDPHVQKIGKATTLHQLGRVAQEQRQWEAAEAYYKDALKIKIEFNDRYSQASTLHQLGRVAQEQRQWEAAEAYYKDALKIQIEFNDRYSQAVTLHQLGYVAQEQRQWEAAEAYYKDALIIQIEFNDRYSQASTLHNLGSVAQEQRQWEAATQYGLDAAEIFIEYESQHELGIVLASLARAWRETHNAEITRKLGELLGSPVEEVEKLLDGVEDTDPE
ncbi:MAG: tetratricopeptide repeat protein [Desulfobacteraceae bacterium]|nr:tetratricopeptide repeat protein [Desulfobacteraceae bacterium]